MNITHAGITYTITGTPSVSYAPDGGAIVHLSPGGSAVITAHDGTWCWKNVRGNVDVGEPPAQGLPITCEPGDVVIITKNGAQGAARSGYYATPGRSVVHTETIVQFVEYAAGAPVFRVFGIGGRGVVEELDLRGSFAIPVSAMDLTRLPSLVPGIIQADFDYLEAIFAGFCGEVRSQYATDSITPDFQHPGYGGYLASCVSMGLLALCSTMSVAAKTTLATRMVQWGLDIAGAFIDGRINQPNGGHMAGRKALVILAGHLLGISDLSNPDNRTRLWQETQAYFLGNPAWWNGWTAGWNCYHTGDGAFLANHPSTWTEGEGVPRSQRYRVRSYMPQVLGAQVGTCLAMRLMGRRAEMGEAFMRMVEQWMKGPSTADYNALVAANCGNVPWGTDYAVGYGDNSGHGLQATAWHAYHRLYPNDTI